jgi:hypothetical protein
MDGQSPTVGISVDIDISQLFKAKFDTLPSKNLSGRG